MHLLTEEEFAFHQHADNSQLAPQPAASETTETNEESEDRVPSLEDTLPDTEPDSAGEEITEEITENAVAQSNPNLLVLQKAPIGKGKGNTDIPQSTREIIAVLAQTEKKTNVAKAFGVSVPTVSNYSKGKTIHGREDSNPELKKTVESTIDKITDRAIDRLFNAIDMLGADDIACLGAKDKADVAVKMSKVVNNLKPNKDPNDRVPQLIIYSPQIISEDRYKTIDV